MKGIPYEFTAALWQHESPGGWHFVSVPANIAKEIRGFAQSEEEGWGRLKATASVGSSEWKTAIWYDTKLQTYLLPLKAEVRRKEQLLIGDSVRVTLWV